MTSIGLCALCAPALAADNYVVIYEGAPNGLAEKLEKLTNLSLERRPYPTAAAIRRMGAEDLKIVTRALNAAGYYAASASFHIESDETPGAKVKAIFEINPGEKFKISRHVIVYEDAAPGAAGREERPRTFEEAEIKVSDRADGMTLEKNQRDFLNALWATGYPSARSTARYAEARIEDTSAEAFYAFNSGPRARFDGIVVDGAIRTHEDFLEELKTWEDGEWFDRGTLVTYRDRLAKTGLFSSVEVAPGVIDENGEAPVRVSVAERKRRTIGAGVSYSTSEGPGGRLFLEYRNMFRRAERARVEIEGSGVAQSATLDFDKPLPAFPGSTYGKVAFLNETTDAFDARSFLISAGFSRDWLDDTLETRAGVALETSKVEPKLTTANIQPERNYFVSIPLSVTYDTESDPLLLNDGVKASLAVIPYFGSDQFTRLETNARSRINFGASDRFTIAGRMRVAATLGQALRTLPVNKRVYSGGGSSVRGYDFQAVGPLDLNGVPIGGRSAVEGAIEARANITKNIQLAAFVDAGAVYSTPLPDFTGDYLVGAGGGVRYLSPIGPIRIDAAVPLEKRATDRSFQVYISLGQPF